MMTKRINEHPILGSLQHGKTISFTFNNQTYEGYEHDTVASALLANGIHTIRKHEETGNPRGIYCNIGHCYECRCTINDVPNVRACLTPIKENMNISSGETLPDPLNPNNEQPLPKTYQEYEKLKGGRKND